MTLKNDLNILLQEMLTEDERLCGKYWAARLAKIIKPKKVSKKKVKKTRTPKINMAAAAEELASDFGSGGYDPY